MDMRSYANTLLHHMAERQLDAPDRGSLTTEEENAVQMRLEEKFSDEFDELGPRVVDWVLSHQRVRQDWIQYRVATATEDERFDALEQI